MYCSVALAAVAAGGPPSAAASDSAAPVGEVMQIEWQDLLPPSERGSSTLVPPTPLHDYLLGESTPPPDQPMNFAINEQLADQLIRLPGFVVPLEIDRQGRVTELFLVPFYGACIHVPPPPPNQIVHVTMAEPLLLESMDAAYWITGRMRIATRETRLGTSAYSVYEALSEAYDL